MQKRRLLVIYTIICSTLYDPYLLVHIAGGPLVDIMPGGCPCTAFDRLINHTHFAPFKFTPLSWRRIARYRRIASGSMNRMPIRWFCAADLRPESSTAGWPMNVPGWSTRLASHGIGRSVGPSVCLVDSFAR